MTARTPLVLGMHHVAVICSDYGRSKRFYAEVLGLEVISEVYREARRSYKLDLRLPDGTQVELFNFPDPPPRPSYPEACGCGKTAGTCRELLAHEKWLWTFVDVEGVEPTNNAGERAERQGVLWRKTSGGTDSPQGSRFVERVLTVVQTCRQQGKNALAFLSSCVEAWRHGRAPPALLGGDC